MLLRKEYIAQGFFQEEGPFVTLQVHSFDKAALQNLLYGKADLTTSAADPPKMIAMMKSAMPSVPATIDTSAKNEMSFALKDKGIASVEGLQSAKPATVRVIKRGDEG